MKKRVSVPIEELVGKRFGFLEVIGCGRSSQYVRVRCHGCGKIVEKRKGNLLQGHSKSCGCKTKELAAEKLRMGRTRKLTDKPAVKPLTRRLRADYSGHTFNYIKVVKPIGSDGHKVVWECQCVCGNKLYLTSSDVRKSKLYSCGCKRRELQSAQRKTHGMSKHPAYAVYRSMIQRCYNPKHRAYHNYGGRGIKVCDRWVNGGFAQFWQDIKDIYVEGYDIDRINNDDEYKPENVRFVPRKVNSRNKRTNTTVYYGGRRWTIAELAEAYGINYTTLLYRLQNGWSVHDAVTRPVGS